MSGGIRHNDSHLARLGGSGHAGTHDATIQLERGWTGEEYRVPVVRPLDLAQSQVRSAADSLLQSIELAVAAEELGADGAYSACTISRAN